jgi:hypothetical protein
MVGEAGTLSSVGVDVAGGAGGGGCGGGERGTSVCAGCCCCGFWTGIFCIGQR